MERKVSQFAILSPAKNSITYCAFSSVYDNNFTRKKRKKIQYVHYYFQYLSIGVEGGKFGTARLTQGVKSRVAYFH